MRFEAPRPGDKLRLQFEAEADEGRAIACKSGDPALDLDPAVGIGRVRDGDLHGIERQSGLRRDQHPEAHADLRRHKRCDRAHFRQRLDDVDHARSSVGRLFEVDGRLGAVDPVIEARDQIRGERIRQVAVLCRGTTCPKGQKGPPWTGVGSRSASGTPALPAPASRDRGRFHIVVDIGAHIARNCRRTSAPAWPPDGHRPRHRPRSGADRGGCRPRRDRSRARRKPKFGSRRNSPCSASRPAPRSAARGWRGSACATRCRRRRPVQPVFTSSRSRRGRRSSPAGACRRPRGDAA